MRFDHSDKNFYPRSPHGSSVPRIGCSAGVCESSHRSLCPIPIKPRNSREGYGFSNDVRALLGGPSFSAASFKYDGGTLDLTNS